VYSIEKNISLLVSFDLIPKTSSSKVHFIDNDGSWTRNKDSGSDYDGYDNDDDSNYDHSDYSDYDVFDVSEYVFGLGSGSMRNHPNLCPSQNTIFGLRLGFNSLISK
jgi:hypothetical protein